jgi:hypothetical protein
VSSISAIFPIHPFVISLSGIAAIIKIIFILNLEYIRISFHLVKQKDSTIYYPTMPGRHVRLTQLYSTLFIVIVHD